MPTTRKPTPPEATLLPSAEPILPDVPPETLVDVRTLCVRAVHVDAGTYFRALNGTSYGSYLLPAYLYPEQEAYRTQPLPLHPGGLYHVQTGIHLSVRSGVAPEGPEAPAVQEVPWLYQPHPFLIGAGISLIGVYEQLEQLTVVLHNVGAPSFTIRNGLALVRAVPLVPLTLTGMQLTFASGA